LGTPQAGAVSVKNAQAGIAAREAHRCRHDDDDDHYRPASGSSSMMMGVSMMMDHAGAGTTRAGCCGCGLTLMPVMLAGVAIRLP
jgi:hypothetical protein